MKNAVVWQSPPGDREEVGFVCERGWDQPILDTPPRSKTVLDILNTLSNLIFPITL